MKTLFEKAKKILINYRKFGFFMLSFVLLSSVVPILSLFSKDLPIDQFCNSLGNYKNPTAVNPPSFKIENQEYDKTKYDFNELYSYFSYDLYDYGCSRFFDDTTTISTRQNNFIINDMSFVFEKTFYPTQIKSEKGTIRMSRINYYCYYNIDELEGNQFYQPNFSADGFVFISDLLAEKLCQMFSISNYIDLIKNEQYAILNIENGNGEKISVSINNIIDSSQVLAARNLNVCKNFSLIYPSPKVVDFFSSSSMFIFSRGGLNGYKDTINYLNNQKCFSNETKVSIFTFNKDNHMYEKNESLSESLLKVVTQSSKKPLSNNVLVITYIATSLFAVFVCLFFRTRINDHIFAYFLIISAMALFLIVTMSFIYCYFWWLLPLLTNYLIFIFIALVPAFVNSKYFEILFAKKRRQTIVSDFYDVTI